MSDIVERLRSISGVDGGTSLREFCQEAAAVIEEQQGEIERILAQAAAEIARLREERRQREALWTACADQMQLVYGSALRPKPLPPEQETKETRNG